MGRRIEHPQTDPVGSSQQKAGSFVAVVKFFKPDKGWGFIFNPQGTHLPDVFVHHSDLQMLGFRYLVQGDLVRFDLAETERGYKAVNVTLEKRKENGR